MSLGNNRIKSIVVIVVGGGGAGGFEIALSTKTPGFGVRRRGEPWRGAEMQIKAEQARYVSGARRIRFEKRRKGISRLPRAT